jgi:hypothetical protein
MYRNVRRADVVARQLHQQLSLLMVDWPKFGELGWEAPFGVSLHAKLGRLTAEMIPMD